MIHIKGLKHCLKSGKHFLVFLGEGTKLVSELPGSQGKKGTSSSTVYEKQISFSGETEFAYQTPETIYYKGPSGGTHTRQSWTKSICNRYFSMTSFSYVRPFSRVTAHSLSIDLWSLYCVPSTVLSPGGKIWSKTRQGAWVLTQAVSEGVRQEPGAPRRSGWIASCHELQREERRAPRGLRRDKPKRPSWKRWQLSRSGKRGWHKRVKGGRAGIHP